MTGWEWKDVIGGLLLGVVFIVIMTAFAVAFDRKDR